ncbi:hypothetical protein OBV_21510 [Oscillibacter valericigenes Sjm18-20]|nr:hypothetical protein OBV_21510 [Oscillibacter valericigenes Sjm18-20]
MHHNIFYFTIPVNTQIVAFSFEKVPKLYEYFVNFKNFLLLNFNFPSFPSLTRLHFPAGAVTIYPMKTAKEAFP